jgi:hypothetical protein
MDYCVLTLFVDVGLAVSKQLGYLSPHTFPEREPHWRLTSAVPNLLETQSRPYIYFLSLLA